eukprot:CAMPEP_0171369448 /NCGR_PEP_ID=MMETSP0879-20121228/7360_1 /TAXON_ID=67004 /ORGANISM="Thalassiosira weissflogii, Strain CCMP1336" /LENGTH=278 /DNA_ID=CAMNT_0011877751 /DNA_START=25 /DNA_END=861 /DNA_ORIENTATION=-
MMNNKSPLVITAIGLLTVATIKLFQSSYSPCLQQVSPQPNPKSNSTFYHHYHETYSPFHTKAKQTYLRNVCKNATRSATQKFDLSKWMTRTGGGLTDEDRVMLGSYYGSANSVFEWGLGESSYIAGHLNVPRYAGVDSDAGWVSSTRAKCPTHFRFSFADIGETKEFGNPAETLDKNSYNYIVAPLMSEMCPFDVYMVDGRYRPACVMMALLHASEYNHDATILMHDYGNDRPGYKTVEEVCDVIQFSGKRLVALRRKENATDEMIYNVFEKMKGERE